MSVKGRVFLIKESKYSLGKYGKAKLRPWSHQGLPINEAALPWQWDSPQVLDDAVPPSFCLHLPMAYCSLAPPCGSGALWSSRSHFSMLRWHKTNKNIMRKTEVVLDQHDMLKQLSTDSDTCRSWHKGGSGFAQAGFVEGKCQQVDWCRLPFSHGFNCFFWNGLQSTGSNLLCISVGANCRHK